MLSSGIHHGHRLLQADDGPKWMWGAGDKLQTRVRAIYIRPGGDPRPFPWCSHDAAALVLIVSLAPSRPPPNALRNSANGSVSSPYCLTPDVQSLAAISFPVDMGLGHPSCLFPLVTEGASAKSAYYVSPLELIWVQPDIGGMRRGKGRECFGTEWSHSYYYYLRP